MYNVILNYLFVTDHVIMFVVNKENLTKMTRELNEEGDMLDKEDY